MKNDELFELLTDLPDELIEMSNPSVPFKRRRFRKSETFLMLIPAVLVSALLWKMHASDNMNEPDSGLSVTTPVTSVNEIYIQPTSENTVSELQPAVTSASTSVSSETFSSNTVSRDTSAVSASGSVYSEKEKKPDAVTAVTEVKEASPVTEINSTVTSVRLTEQTTPVVTVRPEADLEISVVKLFVEDSGYYRVEDYSPYPAWFWHYACNIFKNEGDFAQVKIDNTVYSNRHSDEDSNGFSELPEANVVYDSYWMEYACTVDYSGVEVKRITRIRTNPDRLEVIYEVTNNDSSAHQFGLSTAWRGNIVYTAGSGRLLHESELPFEDYYLSSVHYDYDREHIVARADMQYSSENPMDSIKILSWSEDTVYTDLWNAEPDSEKVFPEGMDNSEIIYHWNQKPLNPGESRSYKIKFDLSDRNLHTPET